MEQLEFAEPRPPLLNGPKRQHFLPRFYLNGFSRDSMLAVYDREKDEVRIQRPENTGVIGHFYTVEDAEGRKRYEVEQMLSDVESKAAPIILKLANKETLTPEERADLSIFIALGMCRTPDLIESIKLINGKMIKRMAKLMFSDVDRAKEVIRERGEESISEDKLKDEARALVEFTKSDQYEVETHHGWAMGMAITLFKEIAPILAGRDWHIVHRNNEKHSFLTADVPLVLTTLGRRPNSYWGVGFGNSDALVVFPLTESCAILIFGREGKLIHKEIEQEQIRHFNLMVANGCQRFVIGRDEALVKSVAKFLNLGKRKWQPKMQMG